MGAGMTLNFQQLALLAVLCTAMHWLLARSAIMKWFWGLRWWPQTRNDYGETVPSANNAIREFFTDLLACTACAGWWLSLGAGLLGIWPLRLGPAWINVLGAGLAGVVVVPILEGALIWGLRTTRIE